MSDYPPGAVKQDPVSLAVAVRCNHPDPFGHGDMEWGVMTLENGGHYATDEQVADWTDLTTP